MVLISRRIEDIGTEMLVNASSVDNLVTVLVNGACKRVVEEGEK